MTTFYINKESLPTCCEVGHTNNAFNPIYKRCFQCATVNKIDYKPDNSAIFGRNSRFYIVVVNCLILFNIILIIFPLGYEYCLINNSNLNIINNILKYLANHGYYISHLATYGYYLTVSIVIGILTIAITKIKFSWLNNTWIQINQKISFHIALLNIVASIWQLIIIILLLSLYKPKVNPF